MSRLSALVTVFFFGGVLAIVLWIGAQEGAFTESEQDVVTTIYPVQFLAQEIAGDYFTVTNIIPPGVEPHDYEPTPRDITRVLAAKLLVAVGAGLDTWVEDMVSQVQDHGAVTRVLDGEMTFFVHNEEEMHEEDEEDLDRDHTQIDEHDHEGMDPHFWLDPLMTISAAQVVLDGFIEADPLHQDAYRQNTQAIVGRLQSLHERYVSGLARCEKNVIIVSHDAFGYLARRYDLTVLPISGLSPEEEPSVRDLANLAHDAERYNIDTIFFETLVSPELAETLANEIGAKTAILNPLEGLSEEEVISGADYFSIMEANLAALQDALICQK